MFGQNYPKYVRKKISSLELFLWAAGIDEAGYVMSSAQMAELCFTSECVGCKKNSAFSSMGLTSYKLIKFEKIIS